MSPMDCIIVEEALSNSTILREIFSFLNEEDSESCCNVSQLWRKVADRLVCSHFQIQLGKPEPVDWEDEVDYECYRHEPEAFESGCIVIRESARYNRKKFTSSDELEFSDVTKILDKALLTSKVSINLTARSVTEDQGKCMTKFLSKYGPLVVEIEFEYNGYFPVNTFCIILLHYVPNLRKLNCTGSIDFEEDSPEDGNFNPDLPQNQHKHLRKISFSTDAHLKVRCLATILKMAPQLDEIQHLPLELINALEVTQKGQVLKTFDYDYKRYPTSGEKGEMFLTHFQTLARLQPKLTSFQLLENPLSVEHGNFFDRIKPLIFSVLESSSETLQSLRIPCTGWRGYESLPRLEALQMLKFGKMDDNYEALIFPANISLRENFPNLSEILFSDYTLNDVVNRLPENSISPWGPQIKFLRVRGEPSVNTLLKLHALFPSIEEFQFLGSSNNVGEILPALSLWTNLKSLTIGISAISSDGRPLTLDCAFTGLSQEVLEQLGDSSRRGSFTDEEIQRLKDESPMSKFKDLSSLTLVFKRADHVFGLSPSANEFGFKHLPHLKVTVEIWRIDEDMESVKKTLEPLAQSHNIAIDCDGEQSKTTVFDASEPPSIVDNYTLMEDLWRGLVSLITKNGG